MKMSKITGTLTALVVAALSLPAAAGSWPNLPAPKSTAKASPANVTARSAPVVDVATGKVNGFEYLGGEAGWQPISHTLVLKAGRLAHSDECDHMIRVVKAPTPEELDAVRYSSPG